MSWSVSNPTYGHIDWLRREVANALGFKPDSSVLTHSQKEEVDSIIQAGLDDFYNPRMMEIDPPNSDEDRKDKLRRAPYCWSFLQTSETLTYNSGVTSANLPARFARCVGEPTTVAGRLGLVSEVQVRQLLAGGATGAPKYACVRVTPSDGTGTPTAALVIAPAPTGTTSVTVRYGLHPERISDARPYPLCGSEHYETVRVACLAVIDRRAGKLDGVYLAQYAERMAASILSDQSVSRADEGLVWSTTAETYGHIDWLRKEVAIRLGFSPNYSILTHAQQERINSLIQAGLDDFYTPRMLEIYPPKSDEDRKEAERRAPYCWSFLQTSETLTYNSGVTEMSLPSRFARCVGEPTTATDRLSLVSEVQVRKILSGGATGAPKYACIRVTPSDGTGTPTTRLVIAPAPTTNTSVTVRYGLHPERISSAKPYPLCSSEHYETVRVACLAACERQEGVNGPYVAQYAERMASSILSDQSVARADDGIVWSTSAQSIGHLDWLRTEVANCLGYSPNYSVLTHSQKSEIDSVIQAGLDEFYSPPPLELNLVDATQAQKERLRKAPYCWTFLQDVVDIGLNAGDYDYTLPANFARFMGDPTASFGPLAVVGEPQLRQLLTSGDKGLPRYVAVRTEIGSGSAQPQRVLLVYPIPEASSAITVSYGLHPAKISDANPWPVCGPEHYETIRVACLMCCERRRGQDGPYTAQYRDRLVASIMYDQKLAEAAKEGVWTEEDTDSIGVSQEFFERRIGIKLGYGPNPNTWNAAQYAKVREVFKMGVRKFIYPLCLPGERLPHVWSWLTPTHTLGTVSGTYLYELPADFSMLKGPIVHAADQNTRYPPIELCGEHQLRQMLQNSATGRPQWAAIRFKQNKGFMGERYELMLYPIPDDDYSLTFRYQSNPERLIGD